LGICYNWIVKILIISDTHRSLKLAEQAIRRHLPADLLIHLGDFYADGKELAEKIGIEFQGVRGNEDLLEGPNELEINQDGVKIFATHGHRYEIDSGLELISSEAKERGARLVLFGHTHKAGIYQKDGIWLLNPGNLFFAEREQSLGVIDTDGAGMVLSIFNFKQGGFSDVRKI